MCVNYAPVQRQVLRDVFGVEPPSDEWRAEAWRDYPAPIIRAGDHGQRECVLAGFGMVPKAEIKRRNEETMQRTGAPPKVRDYDTMNARLETIGKLQSFAKYWRECRLALVGATAVYEPCWRQARPCGGVSGYLMASPSPLPACGAIGRTARPPSRCQRLRPKPMLSCGACTRQAKRNAA